MLLLHRQQWLFWLFMSYSRDMKHAQCCYNDECKMVDSEIGKEHLKKIRGDEAIFSGKQEISNPFKKKETKKDSTSERKEDK